MTTRRKVITRWSASARTRNRLLQAIVAPEDFCSDGEGRRAENAEVARGVGRVLHRAGALRAACAGDDVSGFTQRRQDALDVIADAGGAAIDEPIVERRARVRCAPAFLRGDEPDAQRQQIRVGRVRRATDERNAVTLRAVLYVVPDIVHLHLVPGEAGVVLLDQY